MKNFEELAIYADYLRSKNQQDSATIFDKFFSENSQNLETSQLLFFYQSNLIGIGYGSALRIERPICGSGHGSCGYLEDDIHCLWNISWYFRTCMGYSYFLGIFFEEETKLKGIKNFDSLWLGEGSGDYLTSLDGYYLRQTKDRHHSANCYYGR